MLSIKFEEKAKSSRRQSVQISSPQNQAVHIFDVAKF